MQYRFFHLQAEKLVTNCRDGLQTVPTPDGRAADLRTAISRAYYSSFLSARDLLGGLGYEVTELGACHAVTQKAFLKAGSGCNDRTLETIGSGLGTLATERRRADYDLDQKKPEQLDTAEGMVLLAKSVLDKIDAVGRQVRADVAYRDRIVSAIDRWRKDDVEKGIWRK